MRVFIRYVPVTGAQRSVDNICMNQQGSQRRATMRRAVLVWSDERTTGTPVWSRFSGVLAESFASAEPTGDVRDVVGPTAEGCRAACTARSFNSNNTPTTITKARLHVGEIVLRGIILGRTHGKRLSQGPPCDTGHGRQIIG
jgi:hypothetical protein